MLYLWPLLPLLLPTFEPVVQQQQEQHQHKAAVVIMVVVVVDVVETDKLATRRQ